MIYPWELYAATFAQLVPVVGGLFHVRSLPAARKWFMLWCAFSVLGDGAYYFYGQRAGQNLWLRLV
ncbi:MAG: hypothetical protein AB1762_09760, partial [Gemmatimonadota bacterium]